MDAPLVKTPDRGRAPLKGPAATAMQAEIAAVLGSVSSASAASAGPTPKARAAAEDGKAAGRPRADAVEVSTDKPKCVGSDSAVSKKAADDFRQQMQSIMHAARKLPKDEVPAWKTLEQEEAASEEAEHVQPVVDIEEGSSKENEEDPAALNVDDAAEPKEQEKARVERFLNRMRGDGGRALKETKKCEKKEKKEKEKEKKKKESVAGAEVPKEILKEKKKKKKEEKEAKKAEKAKRKELDAERARIAAERNLKKVFGRSALVIESSEDDS
eukprot:TRINITY_DN36150_c0_g1_i1.p1 TRINITY_DN36150_c0_g1~~TRINITY_DN36150_c0_g1_i1.p1  ORF type:complete len:307 (+),score=116.90 TRINITY_DN36150_c0_g1_i1:109-921(+)